MTESIYRQGDFIEAAAWFSSPDEKNRCKLSISKSIAQADGILVMGPIQWSELSPEHERCPEPPEDAERGVMLLVGEAEVLDIPRDGAKSRFVDGLGIKELLMLRNITRKIHLAYNPGESISDQDCDHMIEAMGPEALEEALSTLH